MGKHQIAAAAAALILSLAVKAGAADTTGSTLTFYGVEMKREDQVTLKEFKSFARSHGQANYVISKSGFVDYDGMGDVILAGYETDQAAAQKIADELPNKGKIIELRVSPSAVSTKKGVGVYKFPLMMTEDSLMGDVWVRTGINPAQRIEKNVILSSTTPNLTNLFKFIGYTDKESGVAYCTEQCSRFDLVSGQKTPLEAAKGEDAAGIRRSIDNLLTKQEANDCKNKLVSDRILNVDKDGYYSGVCTSKGNQVLQVQLKKDSGRWKVINSSWQAPMPIKK